MSDNMTDADRIRQKRMAKIQQQAQLNAEHNKAAAPAAKGEPSKPEAKSAAENPFDQLRSGKVELSSNSTVDIKPKKQNSLPSQRPSQGISQKGAIEAWEHKTVGEIFRLTLDEGQSRDGHGNSLHYVPGVASELAEGLVPPRLTTGVLDQALLEAASDGSDKPLEYLLPCWKRVTRALRSTRSDINQEPKVAILKEARRLCMSYAIFAITMPEMFGQDVDPTANFVPHLLLDVENEKGIDHDFLTEACARFDEDDTIRDALVAAMESISEDLSSKTMHDSHKPHVMAMRNFSRYKPLVIAMAASRTFCPPGISANTIETQTLLGPFFRISPINPHVALSYFQGAKTQGRGFTINTQSAVRLTLQTHQGELFEIINNFIKSGPTSRNQTLDWFALIVNKNHKRRAMRPDPRIVSTDGFMINVTVCLDRLCEPFMDAKFTKVGRIEVEYFRRSPRVEIKDETKINADQQTADAFYAENLEGDSNFISEIFFLTAAAHHYGTEAAQTKLSQMQKEINRFEQEIERIESEREKYASNPIVLGRIDDALRRYREEAEKSDCVFRALEGVLLDELAQARAMSFMRYVIVWLTRLVASVDYPTKSYELPLAVEQPDVFKCLPEYFMEDIVDHFKFVVYHMPQVVSPTQCDELVQICITFLRSSEYIKNPGLKSGLVTILFYGVVRSPRDRDGLLGDVLNAMPFALKHLLHALMKAYIECEHSESHTAFYDKFNIRFEIFQVMKCIWKNDTYHEKLRQESDLNQEFFIQFVNMVLNDATYVLDESFSAFNKIRILSDELSANTDLDETVRKEKEDELEQCKGKAKSYMQLTGESIDTLKIFTRALANAFTAPEVVQRLADMLDYNLEALVGPKASNLKVDSPEQYKFQPAILLGELMNIYLNLEDKVNFHFAVARDGRSYKHENFLKAAEIQRKHNRSKPESDLQRWLQLAERVKQAKADEDAEEEDLGEIPDEWTDPLMATLMRDPVILPVSRQVIDRSTIRQHLLSDPHDPFNRSPLKIEDVIPDTDTKNKIEAWIAERKANRVRKEDAMDTSQV